MTNVYEGRSEAAVKIESAFAIGDRVNVDGCKDLTGCVTAVTWRHPTLINYEVSWVTQGKSESSIIEGWRLALSENRNDRVQS